MDARPVNWRHDLPNVHLTDEQVLELVRQLPSDQRRSALMVLAGGEAGREERMQFAENQLRRLSSERGRDWEQMSEDEREAFVDTLVHEDRACGP